MGKFQDLTGMKFGHLTVKYRGENNKNKATRWWCECDCENPDLILVNAGHLKDGHTQSCGCYHLKIISDRLKKYNTYDLSGEYGVGYANKGEEFYFDLEDYDKIKNYYWFLDKDGYCCAYFKKENGVKTSIKMHRLVMNETNPIIEIDHIHGSNTLTDNRKSNLRRATNSQNSMNHKIIKTNTSGVTGVGWDKRMKKWRARITVNHKEILLGYFNDFDEAVRVRKEAEEKYFGEWSYDYSQQI